MPEKRPHIVIFNPDQWRGEALGHAGNQAVLTPNLDRLAREDGVSFTRAFCQATVCTPSRCSFMSGWYAHVRGHRTMFHMLHQYGNVTDEPVLLKTLKDEGYFVWWGGKNDLVPGQEPVGRYCHVRNRVPYKKGYPRRTANFDAARGEPGSDTYYSFYVGRCDFPEEDRIYEHDWSQVLAACELIRTAPKDRPLCVYLPLHFPHPAYVCEDPWYSAVDRSKLPKRILPPEGWKGKPEMLRAIWERQNMQSWTEDRWDELRATYYAMCSRVDYQFGLVMDALRDAGIYDDTAVFMFSDHGDFTGDYGLVEKNQNTFEDCLTRVPFAVKPPSWVPVKPRASEALVELIDFPATVEALCGIKPKHTHFGRSLLPLLAGDESAGRNAVYCEGGRLHGETHCEERQSSSSYVPTGAYWPRVENQQRMPAHTKATMCRTQDWKYVKRLFEQDELYDLRNDPGERENRIDDPACRDVLLELKETMLTWYQETCDEVPHEEDKR